MAPKKKVVKLDPVPEIIPEPVQADPVQADPAPEIIPDPIPAAETPAQSPASEADEPVDDDVPELDEGVDDDVEFGGEYVDESDDAGPDVFDILSGLFVARDGDTVADVLVNISESMETHNKLLYKLIKVLESKA